VARKSGGVHADLHSPLVERVNGWRLMSRRIIHDHKDDGIDRRGFLECMAWVGREKSFRLCRSSGAME
jgi:hypothetical protein